PKEHAKGQAPALVLRCKDQEYAQQGKTEDHHWRDTLCRLVLLKAHAQVIEAHAGRHGLLEDLLHGFHGLSRAKPGLGRGVDLRGLVQVVAHRELWSSRGPYAR